MIKISLYPYHLFNEKEHNQNVEFSNVFPNFVPVTIYVFIVFKLKNCHTHLMSYMYLIIFYSPYERCVCVCVKYFTLGIPLSCVHVYMCFYKCNCYKMLLDVYAKTLPSIKSKD
jgi:hypothetical protein